MELKEYGPALSWLLPVLRNQAQDAYHFEVSQDFMEYSRPVWTLVWMLAFNKATHTKDKLEW